MMKGSFPGRARQGREAVSLSARGFLCGSPWQATTPNLPTSIIPTKIARLKLSGEFPMGLEIPPLKSRLCLSQTLWNP